MQLVPQHTEEYYSSSPFYRTPPLHPDPGSQNVATGSFYLVISPQARTPGNGIYVSWDSAVAVTMGITGGPPKFATLPECYAPWRAQCEAGEHMHPVSPDILAAQKAPPYSATSPPTTPSCPRQVAPSTPYSTLKATVVVSPTPGYHWVSDGRLPPSSPPPPAPELLGIPTLPFHYAVMGGGIVHVGLLTTTNSIIGAFFAQGHSVEEAECLAADHRAKALEASKASTMSRSDELWESLDDFGPEVWENSGAGPNVNTKQERNN
ncbi:hypothetical protein C8J57DRAFT_1496275 [Mycena rebaudengoi]|nr:hypothetical protein C8J57DRAFT_1496275 [Mycena rebaudengoi]